MTFLTFTDGQPPSRPYDIWNVHRKKFFWILAKNILGLYKAQAYMYLKANEIPLSIIYNLCYFWKRK